MSITKLIKDSTYKSYLFAGIVITSPEITTTTTTAATPISTTEELSLLISDEDCGRPSVTITAPHAFRIIGGNVEKS